LDSANIIEYAQPFLQLLKQGKHQGVVDMVWSAKKFKIYLPTHSVQIVLTLAGKFLSVFLSFFLCIVNSFCKSVRLFFSACDLFAHVLIRLGAELPLYLDENHPTNPGKGDFFTQHPLVNRDGTPNIYNEAFHYARDNYLQRDIEIEVLEMARGIYRLFSYFV
jgi:hypothetical protein